ncbi:zinc-binding protein A33-like [Chanodichthys erythropterus]|uniref:zinc-binding protein A33-like n=1 Tax=Chanodichthys erythropterus TaxID=933992 RepID=UPI00351F3192
MNTTLQELVDHYKKKSPEKKTEVLCDICEEIKLKALKSCLVCQSSYCESHRECHLREAALKKHNLITPASNLEDYTQLMKTQKDVQQVIDRINKIQEVKHSAAVRKIYSSLSNSRNTRNLSEIRMKTDECLETLRRALTQLKDTLQEKLTQNELKRMRQYAVDVTLDPDIAHPNLILSDDGKQVKCGDIWQELPDKPERFEKYGIVLGKERFSSGRFYFEVQVKGNPEWALGVASESINRNGKLKLSPSNGCWSVILRKENEYSACASPYVSLCLKVKPQQVSVFVDYEDGLVSFYDVESCSHIYSYTGQSFTGNLYPFFSPEPIMKPVKTQAH